MLSAMFPNVPTVALRVTETEKTRDIISNSLGMVDPVIISLQSTQTERTYFALLPDTNIHEIEALLLPYGFKISPPGIPRAFDPFAFPGGGEFDPHA